MHKRIDMGTPNSEIRIGRINGKIERPRTVCLEDGRIFVEEKMLEDKAYLKTLPEIIGFAGMMFGKKESDLYEKK